MKKPGKRIEFFGASSELGFIKPAAPLLACVIRRVFSFGASAKIAL
jgi:hypothetical protein